MLRITEIMMEKVSKCVDVVRLGEEESILFCSDGINLIIYDCNSFDHPTSFSFESVVELFCVDVALVVLGFSSEDCFQSPHRGNPCGTCCIAS